MTVYTWMVILLLLAALLLKGNQRNSRAFITAAFIIMFCVMGLRDVNTCGNDSSGKGGSYPVVFRSCGNTDWDELLGSDNGEDNFNAGFMCLTKLLYELTNGDYQMYITLISLFVMFSYMRFIQRYSPSPIQSVVVFLGMLYFIFLFDALKQALAMATLLYAFDAMADKKPIKFVLIVLMAGQLHFPAMVFLPAYWIGKMKISRTYFILLAGLLVFTFIFRSQILRLMLNTYGGDNIEGRMEGVRFLRNKSLVMIAIVTGAYILRPPTNEDTIYRACIIFAGIAIVFQTFCGYNNIFERLAEYYFHTSVIFIPMVFDKGGNGTHLVDMETEHALKSLAPLLVYCVAIWRFLSYVNHNINLKDIQLIWH